MHVHARFSQQRLVKIIIPKCVTVAVISKQSFRGFGSLYREPVPSVQKQYDWDMDPLVSNVTIILHYQPLYHCSDHNKLLTCMYVLCISLDVHTHSSTCNLSLHKEKFEPVSMEHNYFQLMQYIQFQAIFECTLIISCVCFCI